MIPPAARRTPGSHPDQPSGSQWTYQLMLRFAGPAGAPAPLPVPQPGLGLLAGFRHMNRAAHSALSRNPAAIAAVDHGQRTIVPPPSHSAPSRRPPESAAAPQI